jgi:amino acid adenylation domain-containing protein
MTWLLWQGPVNSARHTPAGAALQDADGVMTYAELDTASAQMAALLRSWDIGRGRRVALWMPKTARSVVTMLGTSRAGGAYVPVDPAAPARRAAVIMGNAGVVTLVTSARLLQSLLEFLPELPALRQVLVVDGPAPPALFDMHVATWDAVTSRRPDAPVCDAVETDPAYILYTSGSTGTPKGVVISHRNALTFIEWAADAIGVTTADRVSNHAPLHFDLSVFDIYAALHRGACVCLVPDRIAPFPVELARWIEEQRISVWYSVPSALTRLLRQGQLERFGFTALRAVIFAGEVFPVKHLRDVMECFGRAEFHNWYGPTETNVCTFFDVPRPLPQELADLPIGAACANYDAFALRDDRRAEPGEEGELVVRGPGVMMGYWGLPERTAQSLVQNPLHTDFVDYIYRTGDIVRVADDGAFVFLGRRDHMVKTRGYRVELGEIEHALHQHEAVANAVVVAVPDEDIGARLWAAIVTEPGRELSARDLTSFCMNRIPHYAVPERFAIVQELPHTSTGKVDRQSLLQSMLNTSLQETR